LLQDLLDVALEWLISFNTSRPAAFRDFSEKTLKRTWLCAKISPVR